jgi:hypothetical protein
MEKRTWLFLLTALLLAAGLMFACGKASSSSTTPTIDDDNDSTDDDGSPDDDASPDDDDDDNDDASPDDDDNDDATPPTEKIQFTLTDVLTGAAVPGATCELVRDDGSSFSPPVTVTSDSSGMCTFNGGAKTDLYSAKVTMNGYITIYAFDWPVIANTGGWVFRMVTPLERTGLALLLGVTLDSSKGVVAGGVDWIGSDGTSQDVGCATVSDDASDTFFYFDSTGTPSKSRTNTNPVNGLFLAVNIPPGSLTIHADTNGDTVDTTVPVVFADMIVYAPLTYYYAQYPTNPTPGSCS